MENDQFFTSVSSSARANFHVAYNLPDISCGFSSFATANSGTYCTYSNSKFSAVNVRNDTSSVFQPLYQDSYAQAHVNRYANNQSTREPICGQYSTYTPGCNYLKYDGMFLPRPEFSKFSGDPLEYQAFMQNFETNVEPRVSDQRALFTLLTQHCTDPVRKRIQHLSGKGDYCYQLAKERLFKEYGSPWVVSDVCEQRLKKFPSIKSGDAKEIKRFAELLESSLIVLGGINHFGSLDSLDSLTMLVSKLPYDLRKRWVQKSVQIKNSTGSLAKFTGFTDFVQVVSDEVNSLFGIRSLGIKTSKPLQRTKASAYSVSSANFTSKKPDRGSNLKIGICWFCGDASHKFTKCS